MVGASWRTSPITWAPLGRPRRTRVPRRRRGSSAAVTSARHSSRFCRIRRNSSVPLAGTAPTVALRAEITPLSGASTWVWRSRSSWVCTLARAASTRAWAARSALRAWLICCSLSAPPACTWRVRLALATASSALASASSRAARAWARSACTVSSARRASCWPARTVSLTLTSTWVRRRPWASRLTRASCQAATLPLALSCKGSMAWLGRVVLTVRAGRAGAGSAPWASGADSPSRQGKARAGRARRGGGFFGDVGRGLGWRVGCRFGRGGVAVPAAAGGAVQVDPGQLALQGHGAQAGLRRQGTAPGFFHLGQAGQAGALARLGVLEHAAITLAGQARIVLPLLGRGQVQQGLFHLAHGLAHAGLVQRHGLGVAGLGGL